MPTSFTISTQLDFKSYFKGSLHITYRRPVIICSTAIGIGALILGAVEHLSSFYIIPPLTCGVLGFYLLLVFPLIIYYKVKRELRNKSRMTEQIDYTFSPEHLLMKGETFNMTFPWDRIQKVVESREFFFVHQTSAVALILPKDKMSAEEIRELRKFIQAVSGLKNSLLSD